MIPECLPDLPRYLRKRGGSWQGADHQNGPWRLIPAPQQAMPWSTDVPAVPRSSEPASVTPEPTGQSRQLSPVEELQERYRSAADEYPDPDGLAAALRALMDQLMPDVKAFLSPGTASQIRSGILAIAAELEGRDG